ncbi:MAG: PAS domain S-box protein [Myxococcaceae bacterium]|nr:PAS domain S-box protein [Myxococcaceae bacterium]
MRNPRSRHQGPERSRNGRKKAGRAVGLPNPAIGAAPPVASLDLSVAVIGAMPADAASLARVLSHLPEDSPLCMIVVPYVPGGVNGRAPFAAAARARRMIVPREGQPLEPGHTYFVPYDRPMEIAKGRFVRARGNGVLSPVKHVFGSVAEELGRHALGVLLSGTGKDGAQALRAIKEHGGKAIVQDPGSAVFDEATRTAIAMGLPDAVLDPSGISRELGALAQRSRGPPRAPSADRAVTAAPPLESREDDAPAHDAFRRILALLKGRFGVDLGQYKLTTIQRRVTRRMSLGRFDGLAQYAEHLRTHPDALAELHDDLFIHVTQFFRDPEAFAALAERVFPALLKDPSRTEPIRIWVPGCSTGEEAYSIGMALTEHLERVQSPLSFQIFATDVSEAAIARARRATYPDAGVAGLSPERLERFFDRVKAGYRIRKELRDRCVISRHDFTSNPPFAKLDLISCRNVLSYFGQALQRRVLPLFHFALKPGGFLWLGGCETPGTSSKLFALVDQQHKLYSKLPIEGPAISLATRRFATGTMALPRSFAPDSHRDLEFQRNADQLVLSRYGPPGVVINHHFEVLQFRGRTAPFLEPAAGQPTHNLLKMAHPDLLPALRPLIEAAKKQGGPVRRERLVLQEASGSITVNLEAAPLNPFAPERERQYLVLFETASGHAKTAQRSATLSTSSTARGSPRAGRDDAYVQELKQELEALREYQQALLEEFESSQEELTSANEELEATNEEVQSTNEELDTAKEELQSANEELSTMNDELQARNAELIALNEKLARGEDRFRLMVEGVKDYAIYMLDPEGRVVSWNEGARRMKGYETSEILGEHYSKFFLPEELAAGVPDLELEHARVEGRYETEAWRTRKDGSRFWANVVITRINDHAGKLIGFSKVTRDLTERRQAREALETSEQRFRLMIASVRDYAIFMLNPRGEVSSWNEGARRLKGYEESEILGQHFSIFYPPEALAAKRPEAEMEIALREGHVEDEGWRVRKDGSRFWANVVLTCVRDPSGKVLGFTKVTRDLTERRRAHEALRRLNESLEARVAERTEELEHALAVRDEFLSIASHELKTPLTSLKLQLQMARRAIDVASGRTLSPDAAARAWDRAIRASTALEELIEDLLDVSRIRTGRFAIDLKDVDVSALIDEVVTRLAAQAAQAEATISVDAEPSVYARWDQRRVAQVLTNLIYNALKYAPKSAIHVTSRRFGDRVRIAVRDHGPGLRPEQQEKLFERFERAGASPNVGGMGLGLFISRRIVEAHQGKIGVVSEPGAGATFEFELPLWPSPAEVEAGDGATVVD